MVFKGSTSGTAISTASENATNIISFTLADTSGSANQVSVGIFYGSTITYLLKNESLAGSDPVTYVYIGNPIKVLPGYQIVVTASGACDYYFSIE